MAASDKVALTQPMCLATHAGDKDYTPDSSSDAPTTSAAVNDDTGILTGAKLYLVFGSTCMICLSIVATAIPVLVSDFNAFDQVTWTITARALVRSAILAAVGLGVTFQHPIVAIQVEYHKTPHIMSQAYGAACFFQLLGAALGNGIINTVQSVYLNRDLQSKAAAVPFELVRQSPTAIYTLDPALRPPVIEAYTEAVTKSFIPIIIGMGLTWIFGLIIKNKSTLGDGDKSGGQAAV